MSYKKDFFGKYSADLTAIHDVFIDNIDMVSSVDRDRIVCDLVQLSLSEYIEHHPKEPEYYFDIHDFRFRDSTGQIMTVFNEYFFSSRIETLQIINALNAVWKSTNDCLIKHIGLGNDIRDLKLSTYDVILTVHFLYPVKELIENNIDYQLFKIIYPYRTLEPILRSWNG